MPHSSTPYASDPLTQLADRLEGSGAGGWRNVFDLLCYVPSPRQQIFHDATEYDVLYGGSAGGGKTAALFAEGVRACVRYPGIRVGAFRRTYDELEESLLKEVDSHTAQLEEHWGCRMRRSPYPDLLFANGSVIRFRHAETVQQASRRQGGEYQLLLIDERTLVSPTVISTLEERLRSSNPAIPVLGIRSGTNPMGLGHSFCQARYVKATNYGAHTTVDAHGFSVRFVPAKATDNPHLDAGYMARLDAIPDPARRAAMRDGDWDSHSGMVFAEWRAERHLIDPFPLPETWVRYQGIDYGYANPYAAIWAALDGDGRLYIYREITKAGVGEHDQARAILAAEENGRAVGGPDGNTEVPEPAPVARSADPAMFARRGDAEAISDAYADEGVVLTPAVNDRIAGWSRLHTWLADGPACPHHRAMGWETCPMLHLFNRPPADRGECKACGDQLCEGLAAHIPGAPYSRTRHEDVDTDFPGDHDLDAIRYLVMGIGHTPEFYFHDPDPQRRVAIDGVTPLHRPYGNTGYAIAPGQQGGPIPWR